MSDIYFNEKTDYILNEYELISQEELYQRVKCVLKEVERDTRHKASELTYKLANDIHNMRH